MWKLVSMQALSTTAIRVLLEKGAERKSFIVCDRHPDFNMFMFMKDGEGLDFRDAPSKGATTKVMVLDDPKELKKVMFIRFERSQKDIRY